MVKVGAAVIDVGMNRTEEGCSATSTRVSGTSRPSSRPVPGGVGPMTIACLLENALTSGQVPSGALGSRASELHSGRCISSGGSVPGPSHVLKEEVVGSGHRQVVLEREGLWVHRA